MARSKDRNIESLDPNGAYSVRQVANYVGWHPDHLRQLIREGRVKAYRPNGYEWRIKGSEVARISQRLEHEGRLPSAPSPVDQGQVLEIAISPEQMGRMEPGWNDGGTPAQEQGFWEELDRETRRGFPLLFGQEEGQEE